MSMRIGSSTGVRHPCTIMVAAGNEVKLAMALLSEVALFVLDLTIDLELPNKA